MCSKTIHKNKSTLDLNRVRDIIFQDIYKLLDSFNLEYTVDGDNIFMKCPIHEGSDNPNGLSISLDKKMWRCWTRGCHDHYKSDIFGLVKGILDTDSFSEALKHICKVYNVNGAKKDDSHSNNTSDTNDSEFGTLVRAINRTERKDQCDFGMEHISRPKTDGLPSRYFTSRGYREETLQFFRVYDSSERTGPFRHRAVIPVENSDGNEIGFIGRSTRDFVQPKYIWSKGFKKSKHLYNYHNAIRTMVHLNTLFLVEGQGDVWRLWESGVKNAVGLFGKDISESQKKLLLHSGATNLVVLTDNDQAGREAKIKIKRELGRLFKLLFPKMHTKDLGSMLTEHIEENILNELRGYY